MPVNQLVCITNVWFVWVCECVCVCVCVCLKSGSAQLFKCERSSFHLTIEKEFWKTGTSIFQLGITYNDMKYLVQCLACSTFPINGEFNSSRKPTRNLGSSWLFPSRFLWVLQCQAYTELLRNTMWMNESLEIISGTEWWPLRLKLLLSTCLRDRSEAQQETAKQWLWATLPCIQAETGFLVQELVVGSSQRTQNSGLKYLRDASFSVCELQR